MQLLAHMTQPEWLILLITFAIGFVTGTSAAWLTLARKLRKR